MLRELFKSRILVGWVPLQATYFLRLALASCINGTEEEWAVLMGLKKTSKQGRIYQLSKNFNALSEVFRAGTIKAIQEILFQTELLLQMQRIHESEIGNVFLLCATNCPWEIDLAFLRRFQKRIFVGLPENQDRVELMRQLLNVSD